MDEEKIQKILSQELPNLPCTVKTVDKYFKKAKVATGNLLSVDEGFIKSVARDFLQSELNFFFLYLLELYDHRFKANIKFGLGRQAYEILVKDFSKDWQYCGYDL